MGSYDIAEVCELVGTLALSTLATCILKRNSILYRGDGLILMSNENVKKQTKSEKSQLKIEIKTNLKVVDFPDITFNLSNGTYKLYRKPNDRLLYVNTSSNHPPSNY